MFILDTNQVPTSSKDLAGAIDRSLRQSLMAPGTASVVKIEGALPRVSLMAITLTGCTIDSSQGMPPHESLEATEPGPVAEKFKVTAAPIRVDSAAVNLDLSATDVQFGYARGKSGKLVATLEDAKNGHLLLRLSQQDLEAAVLRAAQTSAASSGVAVQKVEISLTSIGPREVDILLKVTAKKFMSTVIRITGRLSVDDKLNAAATNLDANGEGMVGSLAVGFIRPHLKKLNGQPISLMAFSLGKVQLHDITVDTKNGLEITADFGSNAV